MRFLYYTYQRLFRGWDDSELWSLDHSFALWIVPRLKRMKEIQKGFPANLSDDWEDGFEKWNIILNEMIEGFVIKINEFDEDIDCGSNIKYTRAKELFLKYLDDLWI